MYYKKQMEIDSNKADNFLFLDAGNTHIKAAVNRNDHWEMLQESPFGSVDALKEWVADNPESCRGLILSSVRMDLNTAVQDAFPDLPVKILQTGDIPDHFLDYDTPETLGIDRFLACFGAVEATSKAAVVIDAGTACTIDFISSDRVYRGGVIAPGFQTFSHLLSTHAPALPFIDEDTFIPETWPGKSTRDSLSWGQAAFYRDALRAALKRYEETYEPFDIYLTGGDAQRISELLKLKGRIRPYLVFEGMRRVLNIE